ncbi:MAG TPA: class I SAM-dependent methyltransferase [Candidatus Dormibacteraeota bacterium]|nr:class I SAM-dependent methyltransferase [Candidatus Dormibacteraeota bacterium]
MSEKRTEVTPELEAFMAPYWATVDPRITAIQDDIHARQKYPMQISLEQVALHGWLCRLIEARRVLEVGTYLGLSATAFALSLPDDGHVDTVEIDNDHADIAEEWFRRHRIESRITVHRGSALDVVPGLPGPYDLCFLDGYKPDNRALMEMCIERTRPGGLILVDNVFNDGNVVTGSDAGAAGARDALELGRVSKELDSVVVPVADGLLVSRRL